MMVKQLASDGSERRGWQAIACVTALLALTPAAASDKSKSVVPEQMMQLSVEPVHQRVMETARRGRDWIVEGYNRSPVLVVGLGLAGALPLVAALFALGRAIRRRSEHEQPRSGPVADDLPMGGKAWIDTGQGSAPIMFVGELLRIGRHSDNDISLEHDSVHRHHALIQRTPDNEYHVIDLTAGRGNKLLLNGTPVGRARLAKDDRITLGDITLTFHLGAKLPSGDLAPTPAQRPSSTSARETTDDDGDTAGRTTGRAADRIETRRIKPSDGFPARGADRSGT